MSEVDLSFTENMELITISGGDIPAILSACKLDRVKQLYVREFESSETKVPVLNAPQMEAFDFKTRVAGTKVPSLNAPRLRVLRMSSTQYGMLFQEALESAPDRLLDLSIQCKHDFSKPVAMVHGSSVARFSGKLRFLDLQEVSAPFVEDPYYEFPRVQRIKLNLVKRLDVSQIDEDEQEKEYLDRYMSQELHLSCFNFSQENQHLKILQCLPNGSTDGWSIFHADCWTTVPLKIHLVGFKVDISFFKNLVHINSHARFRQQVFWYWGRNVPLRNSSKCFTGYICRPAFIPRTMAL